MMNRPRIGFLIYKYKRGTISSRERHRLENWLTQSHKHKILFQKILNSDELLNRYVEDHQISLLTNQKEIWNRMVDQGMVRKMKIPSIFHRPKLTVAASLLLAFSLSAYLFYGSFTTKRGTSKNPSIYTESISAAHFGAILTLSNSSQIPLDSLTSKVLNESGTTLVNENGELRYSFGHSNSTEAIYNTLATTNGQMYSVVLSDGSKVWLNSASSIKYPVVFTGHVRNIEITGEVYLEVAHNKSKPFKLSVAGNIIEVLGTSFNVKAFDTSHIKTTLLKGGIRVSPFLSSIKNEIILTPGQQATITKNSVSISTNVDLQEILAWKNGIFYFNRADVKEIMNQLRRWYDVDIRYADDVKGLTFSGEISRYDNIVTVLEMLELTQKLNFQLSGRTIVVSRY